MYTTTKTIIPQLIDTIPINNPKDVARFTSTFSSLTSFTNELSSAAVFNNSQTQCDSLYANANFFLSISASKYDVEFLDNFVNKLHLLPDYYQTYIKQKISDLLIFERQSDTIGFVDNVYSVLSDSVIPFNDITCSIYPAPKVLPVNILTKASLFSQSLGDQISQATTTLFRTNIINIQGVYAVSDEAHGSNLITDFGTLQTRRKATPILTQQLSAHYLANFSVVTFNGTINDNIGYNSSDQSKNLQVISNASYSQNVEGKNITVDLLGKRIKQIRSTKTIKEFLDSYQGTILQQKNIINSTISLVSLVSGGAVDINKVVQPIIVQKKNSISKGVHLVPQSVSKITTSMPEYSRTPYANAGNSPYSSINGVKGLICKLKDLHFSLGGLGGISLPKMPAFFTNFSFKGGNNPLKGLLIKAEQQAIKLLKGLIPALPDFEAMFKKLSGSITSYLKDLFTCNQDKL